MLAPRDAVIYRCSAGRSNAPGVPPGREHLSPDSAVRCLADARHVCYTEVAFTPSSRRSGAQSPLVLEDGKVFRGLASGAAAERGGEVVFNTSITGYQEIFTDPSYAQQLVCLTFPHIGNVGTNEADNESGRPYFEGLIVREFSPMASSWRSEETAQEFLTAREVPVISRLDTRALVRHLRQHGCLRGMLSSRTDDVAELVEKARALPEMAGQDLARTVTTAKPYTWDKPGHLLTGEHGAGGTVEPRFHVVAFDFGIKRTLLRSLVDGGCRVTVVPAMTSSSDVLALQPDGVFLSNGPGDPEPCGYAVKTVRELLGRLPLFGVCLGHQILGLALGGRTFKLKFGHHGGNHPVQRLDGGQVEITAQNHGFAVDADSLPDSDVEVTHRNLNDGTLEGLRHRSLPAFSVQYHPEASPGPHDSHYLFGEFLRMMEHGAD